MLQSTFEKCLLGVCAADFLTGLVLLQIRTCEYNMTEGGIPAANVMSLCSANSASYMSPVQSKSAHCPPVDAIQHVDEMISASVVTLTRFTQLLRSQQLGDAPRLWRGVSVLT